MMTFCSTPLAPVKRAPWLSASRVSEEGTETPFAKVNSWNILPFTCNNFYLINRSLLRFKSNFILFRVEEAILKTGTSTNFNKYKQSKYMKHEENLRTQEQ